MASDWPENYSALRHLPTTQYRLSDMNDWKIFQFFHGSLQTHWIKLCALQTSLFYSRDTIFECGSAVCSTSNIQWYTNRDRFAKLAYRTIHPRKNIKFIFTQDMGHQKPFEDNSLEPTKGPRICIQRSPQSMECIEFIDLQIEWELAVGRGFH